MTDRTGRQTDRQRKGSPYVHLSIIKRRIDSRDMNDRKSATHYARLQLSFTNVKTLPSTMETIEDSSLLRGHVSLLSSHSVCSCRSCHPVDTSTEFVYEKLANVHLAFGPSIIKNVGVRQWRALTVSITEHH